MFKVSKRIKWSLLLAYNYHKSIPIYKHKNSMMKNEKKNWWYSFMWVSKRMIEHTSPLLKAFWLLQKVSFKMSTGQSFYDLSGLKWFSCILREHLSESHTLWVWLAGGLFVDHFNELFMHLHENHKESKDNADKKHINIPSASRKSLDI